MTSHPINQSVIDFTAGAVGGVASVFTGHPLDTTKVKMQLFPSLYCGFIHCFILICKQEGLRGLYKGLFPSLLTNIIENAVLFLSYGLCQDVVRFALRMDEGDELRDIHKALAGSLASIFSATAVCPTALVKCRLQAMHQMEATGKVTSGQKSTVWSVAKTVLKNNGPLGFFQGWLPTVVREIPGYFFFFGAYELSRSTFAQYMGTDKNSIGILPLIFSGGCGGACFWLAVFPVDSVKTRIQVLSLVGRQEGLIKTFMGIVRNEGISTLYSGLTPTLIRTFPATGALFFAYEWSHKFMMEKAGL